MSKKISLSKNKDSFTSLHEILQSPTVSFLGGIAVKGYLVNMSTIEMRLQPLVVALHNLLENDILNYHLRQKSVISNAVFDYTGSGELSSRAPNTEHLLRNSNSTKGIFLRVPRFHKNENI